jgi:Orsellinic acid/F9775 biosynthesis cluster protein D
MIDPAAVSASMQISKLPDQLEPFLTLLDNPPGLSVCKACQTALLPKSLMDHLRKHHQLPIELRSTVRSLVVALPSLDFEDVPSNLDGSPPVEALRVVDAYQCRYCRFIRRDLSDVRKHINKEHTISAAGSYYQIQAQSWFGGRRAVYWRVCAGATDTAKEMPEQGGASTSNELSAVSTAIPSTLCRFAFSGFMQLMSAEQISRAKENATLL